MDEMQMSNAPVAESENRDYKYMLQDISTLYLGAKYTYGDLIEERDISFKVKTMVNRLIRPELEKDEIDVENLSLASHFYYMEGSGYVYQTYLQLKTKVKFSIMEEKKGFGGKVKKLYTTKVLKLEEFVKMTPEEKEKKGVFIQEIAMSKLALMGI